MVADAPNPFVANVYGRALLDLQALTLAEHGKLLLSNEYAEGLALERRRLGRDVNILFFTSLALSLALEALVGKQIGINLVVVSAQGITLGREIFVAAITMTFAIFTVRYVSLMMITVTLTRLFQIRNVESYEFLLAHKDATFLFFEAFRIRLLGYASNLPHKIFILVVTLLMTAVFLFQLMFQVCIIAWNSHILMSGQTIVAQIVGWFSIVVLAICFFAPFASLLLKFHFRMPLAAQHGSKSQHDASPNANPRQ